MIGGDITMHCLAALAISCASYAFYAAMIAPAWGWELSLREHYDRLAGIAVGIFTVWFLWGPA